MNKSAMLLCAAMSIAVWSLPASAQSRLKTCNDEWNAMKANNTVGDKKYADFRKECLARTAAAPAAAPGESEASPTVPPLATAPRTKAKTATPGAPTPSAATPTASDAGFPDRRIAEIFERIRWSSPHAYLPRPVQREQGRHRKWRPSTGSRRAAAITASATST